MNETVTPTVFRPISFFFSLLLTPSPACVQDSFFPFYSGFALIAIPMVFPTRCSFCTWAFHLKTYFAWVYWLRWLRRPTVFHTHFSFFCPQKLFAHSLRLISLYLQYSAHLFFSLLLQLQPQGKTCCISCFP